MASGPVERWSLLRLLAVRIVMLRVEEGFSGLVSTEIKASKRALDARLDERFDPGTCVDATDWAENPGPENDPKTP